MATDDLPRYEYCSLSSDQVRLLYLQAGSREATIRLKIKVHSIGELPSYEALSYCWGDTSQQLPCIVEEEHQCSRIDVSENLWLALKRVRKEEENVALLADQICINQANLLERSWQVKLMANVYNQATRVIIWLGSDDEDTEMVFNLLQELLDQILSLTERARTANDPWPKYLPLQLTPREAPEWEGFRKLFKRAWFSRTWVFQEVALARQAFLVCGESDIPWGFFYSICAGVQQYDRQKPRELEHLEDRNQICNIMMYCKEAYNNPTFKNNTDVRAYLKLENLIRNTLELRCTIPSDKVYALLNLASDVDLSQFPVDYRQAFRSTFAFVTRFLIKQHEDLTALDLMTIGRFRYSHGSNGPCNSPSWVPDYRRSYGTQQNSRLAHSAKVMKHGSKRQYNATGLTKTTLLQESPLQLSLRGVCVGRIVDMSDIDANVHGETSIGPNVLAGGQWHHFAIAHSVNGVYLPTEEQIDVAFSRIRFRDILPGERTVEDRRDRQSRLTCLYEPAPTYLATSGFVHGQDAAASRILQSTTRTRLYATDSGYLGLAHQTCQVGDWVYLLLGGETPYVLQRLDDGTYHFNGETYVHGIMDGELLASLCRTADPSLAGMENSELLNSLGDRPLPISTELVTIT